MGGEGYPESQALYTERCNARLISTLKLPGGDMEIKTSK
jgi:hypothetical protein